LSASITAPNRNAAPAPFNTLFDVDAPVTCRAHQLVEGVAKHGRQRGRLLQERHERLERVDDAAQRLETYVQLLQRRRNGIRTGACGKWLRGHDVPHAVMAADPAACR
jgi:hypothetical protein